MNTNKIISLVVSIFTALNFTACQSKEEQYRIKTKDCAYYDMSYNVYENGAVYLSDTQQACFIDFKSMKGVPLCNKPNCVHNNDDCLSNICAQVPIIYKDHVYYFESKNEIVDSDDKKSQSCKVYSKCMRASLYTGEIETFSEFEGIDPTGGYRYVINDKILYFIGAYNAYQWNDGTWSYSSNGGKQYLCSIDLENGEFYNYGLVNDSPYAENNVVVEGNSLNSVSDQIIISGIYNNKIICITNMLKISKI